MTYVLYILGFLLVLAGMVMAANALGISETWIVIGVVIVVGIAILGIASSMAQRGPGGPPAD